jgi:hypothetical protein
VQDRGDLGEAGGPQPERDRYDGRAQPVLDLHERSGIDLLQVVLEEFDELAVGVRLGRHPQRGLLLKHAERSVSVVDDHRSHIEDRAVATRAAEDCLAVDEPSDACHADGLAVDEGV